MHVWMSQVKVSGAGVVGEWSTPIRISGINGKDGADGTDVEFIYKQTTISTPPTKPPETSQEVDYVPLGWSDNPQGVNSTYLYEWICVRYKIAGVWGEFSSPVVWSKWGEKGMDGDGYEYIYKRTTASTSPSRPTEISQTDDFIPMGGWMILEVLHQHIFTNGYVLERKQMAYGEDSLPQLYGQSSVKMEMTVRMVRILNIGMLRMVQIQRRRNY